MSQSGQPAPAFVAGPASVPTAGVPRTPELMPRPDPFGRHTLGRQLVVRVTALVALAALLITTATALAARQLLRSQLDGQLDTVTARLRDPAGAWPIGGPSTGLLRPGQPIGTLASLRQWRYGAGRRAAHRARCRRPERRSGHSASPGSCRSACRRACRWHEKFIVLADWVVSGRRLSIQIVASGADLGTRSSAYRCMRSMRR